METPVKEALEMLNKGYSKEEIARNLEPRGYTLQQITDAINQAQIKKGVESMPGQEMQPSMMDEGDLDIPIPQSNSQNVQPAQNVSQTTQQYSQAYQPLPQQQMNYEEMQAVVEQIIEEKWKEMVKNIGDISIFKARVADDIEAVKQEVLRTQKRLEDLQVAVLGKVKDYNESVTNIGSDMKALEQVLSKIIEPLTQNVKDLNKITEELRKK
jgi:hypothetical protein